MTYSASSVSLSSFSICSTNHPSMAWSATKAERISIVRFMSLCSMPDKYLEDMRQRKSEYLAVS